ncbi:hypothetical protein, partial [Bradyrhizobium guangdongense]|uniref:hypothetical protein n=1 Tax=Bradyrhizobium guangdongense TaxID=1325090 RepID=UPI001AECFEC6
MLLSVTISSTQLPELAALSRQSTATTVTNIPVTSSVVSDYDEDASGVPEPVTRKQHVLAWPTRSSVHPHLAIRIVKRLLFTRSRTNTGTAVNNEPAPPARLATVLPGEDGASASSFETTAFNGLLRMRLSASVLVETAAAHSALILRA